MNMIFKLFGASALMFLGVACTSCEKEKGESGKPDIPMEQVSYKALKMPTETEKFTVFGSLTA